MIPTTDFVSSPLGVALVTLGVSAVVSLVGWLVRRQMNLQDEKHKAVLQLVGDQHKAALELQDKQHKAVIELVDKQHDDAVTMVRLVQGEVADLAREVSFIQGQIQQAPGA